MKTLSVQKKNTEMRETTNLNQIVIDCVDMLRWKNGQGVIGELGDGRTEEKQAEK